MSWKSCTLDNIWIIIDYDSRVLPLQLIRDWASSKKYNNSTVKS
jgi:hypothetical protein